MIKIIGELGPGAGEDAQGVVMGSQGGRVTSDSCGGPVQSGMPGLKS